MENVDLQFAEATLNQRIIKVIVLSILIGVSAIINRYFSLIAVLVFIAAVFGLVDDFSMRITHSDDPFSLTASTVTILRLIAISLIGKMILQVIGEQSSNDTNFT
jgi:DMSO reductase anchor subunit